MASCRIKIKAGAERKVLIIFDIKPCGTLLIKFQSRSINGSFEHLSNSTYICCAFDDDNYHGQEHEQRLENIRPEDSFNATNGAVDSAHGAHRND